MTNQELFEAYKELMTISLTGVKAEIKSGNDMLDYKLDRMIDHQRIANHRVNKLEDNADEIKKNLGTYDWLKRHPKLSIAIAVGGWFVLNMVSEFFTIKEIINLIK